MRGEAPDTEIDPYTTEIDPTDTDEGNVTDTDEGEDGGGFKKTSGVGFKDACRKRSRQTCILTFFKVSCDLGRSR